MVAGKGNHATSRFVDGTAEADGVLPMVNQTCNIDGQGTKDVGAALEKIKGLAL